jgi:hypothetical protein
MAVDYLEAYNRLLGATATAPSAADLASVAHPQVLPVNSLDAKVGSVISTVEL